MKNREGSALGFVIIFFMVMTILGFSVISINANNLKQARYQEYSMEAYYLSYSGIEMGYTALLENNKDLFNKTKGGSEYDSITDSNTTKKDCNGYIEFGNGKLDIKIVKVKEGIYKDWVKITSIGYVNDMEVSRTRSLYINPDNQAIVKWENN